MNRVFLGEPNADLSGSLPRAAAVSLTTQRRIQRAGVDLMDFERPTQRWGVCKLAEHDACPGSAASNPTVAPLHDAPDGTTS